MRLIKPFLFILFAIAFTSPALAAAPDTCKQYANKAIDQLHQAQSLGLPTPAPVWSGNYQLHYNWCLSQSEAALAQGSALRQAQLDKAKKPTGSTAVTGPMDKATIQATPVPVQKPAKVAAAIQGDSENTGKACERYAAESVRQNQENLSLGAGLTGPAWSNDYRAHYNWCIQGNNLSSTPQHLADREKALQEDAVKFAKEPFKRYATESVRQDNQSKAMGANFPPPVWSSDFKAHYDWSRQGKNVLTTPGHLATREKKLQEYAIQHNKGTAMKMMKGIKTVEMDKQPSTPEYGNPALVAKPKGTSVTLAKRDSLRQSIGQQNGGKLEVTPTTPFSIPKGILEIKHLIDIPETGLYKIHIALARTTPNVYISPRIDAENYSYHLQSNKSIASSKPTLKTTPSQNRAQFQKTTSGSYSPWIVNDRSISTADSNPSDYYFWVDKDHLPVSGKLQFRLEVTKLEKKGGTGSKGEIGESGFVAATPVPLKDHAEVKGNFRVDHVVSHKTTFHDKFNINGSEVPYSIVTLPSVQQSGMEFSVIETPILELSKNQNGLQSPTLSFFIANAERLSSQNGQLNHATNNTDGFTVVKNKNAWIYQDILSKEYGQFSGCNRLTLNGTTICSKEKKVRYYSWDMPAQGYNGSLLLDVEQPPTGSYSTVVTNNPIDARVTSLEIFTTRGWLAGSGLVAGDNLRNEVVVAARNAAPIKWTYVAELSRIAVSDQAETGDDDADDNFGEFTLLTTSTLTEPLRKNEYGEKVQLTIGPDQVVNRSMPFPMIDNEDRPNNFYMRPLGNKGGDPVNNAGAATYPKIPIFVMDYDKLNTYDDLLLNVLMTEHDKKTFWQENGAAIKAFSDWVIGLVKDVAKFDAMSLGKNMYSFAKTELNNNSQVDDFMGNAAILVFKQNDFGLLGGNEGVYTLEGPAESNCFGMSQNQRNAGNAVTSESSPGCSNSRKISVTIKLRRIQQLDSWADIQLVDYTPVADGVYPFLPQSAYDVLKIEKKRDQHLTEGLLSNSHSSYQSTSFKDVKPWEIVTVRTPQQPSPSPASSTLNKSVILGSEWERGQQTWNSQLWYGTGFTYYQAKLEDITALGRFPAATISFTLYHEDVIKYADRKGYQWIDYGGDAPTMGIKSVKIPNSNFYKVDIKLLDSGDWLEEVNLVAYVHVN